MMVVINKELVEIYLAYKDVYKQYIEMVVIAAARI